MLKVNTGTKGQDKKSRRALPLQSERDKNTDKGVLHGRMPVTKEKLTRGYKKDDEGRSNQRRSTQLIHNCLFHSIYCPQGAFKKRSMIYISTPSLLVQQNLFLYLRAACKLSKTCKVSILSLKAFHQRQTHLNLNLCLGNILFTSASASNLLCLRKL